MNRFLNRGPNREKKPYDRENLQRAYAATLQGMSVYRAARVYTVPESTLRDRTRQNVELDCRPGPSRIFSMDEEKQLVDHIIYMGNIGYGYSVMDIRCMAADYGRSLGKNIIAKGELSADWFYSFMGRWEQLKTVKPQKLSLQRAKMASKETIDLHLKELKKVIDENGLGNAPERIWNIDESGFSTEHTPPKIVCDKNTKPQSVTSPRSKTVTFVGGINALGNHVPPFYIFPGKRWQDCLLEGAVAGSVGHMTESGWINRGVFEQYITSHLAKYAGLNRGADNPASLILYDGHKSHISLTLTDWAKERNVILFVLPPHSSHLTQPLDVGVFGPMKVYYNRQCRAYMHDNPGVSITTRDIARLTAVPFIRAFSTENITSAFRKAGIFPMSSTEITEQQTAPATIYPKEQTNTELHVPDQLQANSDNLPISFLDSRKINKVVQRPKKKFQPPFRFTGNLLSESNLATLQLQESVKGKKPANSTTPTKSTTLSPRPSTSSTSKYGKTHMEESTTDDDDDEKCCICKASEPPQLNDSTSEEFAYLKWGQCDVCRNWVHLKYCTKITVIRRDTFFKCPNCE